MFSMLAHKISPARAERFGFKYRPFVSSIWVLTLAFAAMCKSHWRWLDFRFLSSKGRELTWPQGCHFTSSLVWGIFGSDLAWLSFFESDIALQRRANPQTLNIKSKISLRWMLELECRILHTRSFELIGFSQAKDLWWPEVSKHRCSISTKFDGDDFSRQSIHEMYLDTPMKSMSARYWPQF